MQHAFLKANMENLCLEFLTYLYVSVPMTCHHLQESLMMWYLLELALSSKQPITETKIFSLFLSLQHLLININGPAQSGAS